MDKEPMYTNIFEVGMELFRKNNDSFYHSKLSDVMSKIFIAANKEYGIDDIEDEYYMKSGTIPNRIYYIYSNRLREAAPRKIYDIVSFNGDTCIWFYSNNAIDMIDVNPVLYINNIYDALLKVFRPTIRNTFMEKENKIVKVVMIALLLQFLNDTYGVLDLEKCLDRLSSDMISYTHESARSFINDIIDNYNEKSYFIKREYLSSYLLLEPRLK